MARIHKLDIILFFTMPIVLTGISVLIYGMHDIKGRLLALYAFAFFLVICIGFWFMSDAGDLPEPNTYYSQATGQLSHSSGSHPYEGPLSAEDRGNFINYYSAAISFGAALISLSIFLMTKGVVVGSLLFCVGVAFCFVPLRHTKKSEFKKKAPLYDASYGVKALAVLSIYMLALVPWGLTEPSDVARASIDIEFGDESVHVHGYNYDHEFQYDQIENLQYDAHFEMSNCVREVKSDRIVTGIGCKDKVWYEFTRNMYVWPCITLSYNGSHYAFNTSSVDLTKETFEKLKEHVSTTVP